MTRFLVMALVLVSASSFAEDKKKDPPKKESKGDQIKEVTKALQVAFNKGELPDVKAALARAELLRDNYDDKKYSVVAKAVAKGLTHKRTEIAIEAVSTLGKLRVPGATKMLGKLLSPPAKIPDDKLALHLAAIEAAGAMHEPSAVKTLEKTLMHPNAKIGVAAAQALSAYKSMEPKPRIGLCKRLVKSLATLEKNAASPKEEIKNAAEPVRAAAVETLKLLTGQSALNGADQFEKWLKTAGTKKSEDE